MSLHLNHNKLGNILTEKILLRGAIAPEYIYKM